MGSWSHGYVFEFGWFAFPCAYCIILKFQCVYWSKVVKAVVSKQVESTRSTCVKQLLLCVKLHMLIYELA